MTTPTAEQVAAIADRLTKAQVKRLLNIHTLNERRLTWSSSLGDVRMFTSRATSRTLFDMGLIVAAPMSGHALLTSLGLAVRQHIQETTR